MENRARRGSGRSLFASAAIALVALIAVHRMVAAQTGVVIGRDTTHFVIPPTAGRMTPEQARALVPRVATLAAQPSTIRLRVGDTLFFDSLGVAALDSSGKVLGVLRAWDIHLRRGLTRQIPASRAIVAVLEGVADFGIMYPRIYWFDRPDPPAMTNVRVEILHAPEAAGSPDVDIFCGSDLDSAIAVISSDYAGFAAVAKARRAQLDSVVASTRRDARTATNPMACSAVVARFVDFFHDQHLTLIDRETQIAADTGRRTLPGSVAGPSIRFVDDSTALIRLPDFRPESRPQIDSLLAVNREQLSRTPLLILDVRGNRSGTTHTYEGLRRLFASDSIHVAGNEILSSSANALALQNMVNGAPDSARAHFRQVIDEMRSHAGQFVGLNPERTIRVDGGTQEPRRVALIVDRGCADACEEFVLEAKQSAKVFVVGDNTAGNVDYTLPREAALPSHVRTLVVPMARSRRLQARHLDWVGIMPDFRVNPASAIVEFTVRRLHAAP